MLIAIIDKRWPQAGVSEVMNIIGNVKDLHCIMVDDMVDSGGTLCNAADALIEAGARSVSAYCSHGVLSGNAVERIDNSKISDMVVTDTIKATQLVLGSKKIRQLTVSKLLAEAISRIHNSTSISDLFK